MLRENLGPAHTSERNEPRFPHQAIVRERTAFFAIASLGNAIISFGNAESGRAETSNDARQGAIVTFLSLVRHTRIVLLLPVTFSFMSMSSQAQAPKDIAQLTQALPSASQKVIERLSTFDNLPAAQWRYHAGDLPHGESPTLDDSAWPIVEPHSKASFEAAWYRRTIEVPKTLNGYDLTGARIWFQLVSRGNGPMPEIIYFNGRHVALGDDLEPIVLFDPAKPGDKITVAVKLLHSIDEKNFNAVNLKIDFAANRPNPSDLRLQFLTSAACLLYTS